MRKSVEIKKEIKNKKMEIEKITNEGDFATAAALADDLNKMLDELKAAETVEKSEEPNNTADEEEQEPDSDTATNSASFVPLNHSRKNLSKLRNRAFNKLVFKNVLDEPLTDAERRAYFNDGEDSGGDTTDPVGQRGNVPAKGGYLIPTEQLNILREYRKGRVALKDFCHIMTVNSRSGNMPTIAEEKNLLLNFDELNQIQESDLDFGQLKYEVNSYGDIIKISNELIQDANFNMLEIIGNRLALKTVNTENAEILKILDSLSGETATGYKDFMKALNVSLDPVYYSDARIFTNQDGLQIMSTWEDNQKRPLLVPDVAAPDTYRFRGKEIVVLPNSQLATDETSNKVPFYIGKLFDFVMFCERVGVEIAVSTEYAFGSYATALRCVTRFGVVKDDSDAMVKLEVVKS